MARGQRVRGFVDSLHDPGADSVVTSVGSADTTLTITPTLGNVLAKINLANANTWSSLQTFSAGINVSSSTITDFEGTGLLVGSGILNVVDGDIDHGGIGGLTDDDHSGHPWLAGRSGGQFLFGGTVSGNKLELQANTVGATDGEVKIHSFCRLEDNLIVASPLFFVDKTQGLSGRIGVGTITPQTTFHVKEPTGGANMRIESGGAFAQHEVVCGTNKNANFVFKDGGTGKFIWRKNQSQIFELIDVANSNSSPFKVFTGSATNTLVIDGNSRVGVGGISPLDKLHVFGNIRIDSDIDHDGSNIGFFGITAAARAGATDDIKDALTTYGLLQGTSATPLNLDGGALTVAAASISGDITHTGTNVGFYSATPVNQPGATEDIKDALTTIGLLQGTSATPLDLDGGTLTAATATITTIVISGDSITDFAGTGLDASTGTLNAQVAGTDFEKSLAKHFSLEDPTSSEDRTWFYTNIAITVVAVEGVLNNGTSTPTVTVSIHHHTDRANAGNKCVDAQAVTSITTGDDVTLDTDVTIPAASFIWVETTAQGGTTPELALTLRYTED